MKNETLTDTTKKRVIPHRQTYFYYAGVYSRATVKVGHLSGTIHSIAK